MTREQKIRKDSKALKDYRKRLERERRAYMKEFEAFSVNQRRSRAAAIGECVLQAMDDVRGLARVKDLVNGSLEYMFNEQKVQDPDGRKGFKYSVAYRVVSTEPAHSKEDIDKEIEETFEKMMMETDEMFPQEEDQHAEEKTSD